MDHFFVALMSTNIIINFQILRMDQQFINLNFIQKIDLNIILTHQRIGQID